jgi:hypothetical protein
MLNPADGARKQRQNVDVRLMLEYVALPYECD